jgi:alpha-tubulin suppressor-like RCC1 family protein
MNNHPSSFSQANASGQLGRGDAIDFGTGTGQMSTLGLIAFSNPKSILDISAGNNHVCALRRAGVTHSAICWGMNLNGQLGLLGGTGSIRLGDGPGEMNALASIVFLPTHAVAQVNTMISSSCALFTSGRLICWGFNSVGQLGRNDNVSQGLLGTMTTLDFISFSDTIPALQIAGHSGQHACALFLNRRVRCWGSNTNQNLGEGTTIHRGTAVYPLSTSVFVTFNASINNIPIEEVQGGL